MSGSFCILFLSFAVGQAALPPVDAGDHMAYLLAACESDSVVEFICMDAGPDCKVQLECSCAELLSFTYGSRAYLHEPIYDDIDVFTPSERIRRWFLMPRARLLGPLLQALCFRRNWWKFVWTWSQIAACCCLLTVVVG